MLILARLLHAFGHSAAEKKLHEKYPEQNVD